MVVRPICSGMEIAFITGPSPARKKLVFDSSVPVRWPRGRFATVPAAPITSANAISAPPFTRRERLMWIGLIRISARTRFFVIDTMRMPSARGMPLIRKTCRAATGPTPSRPASLLFLAFFTNPLFAFYQSVYCG